MVSDGYGYGRAIVDFMQWESDSGRLQNSDWWRAVNGQMLDDMSAALDAWNSGQRHSDNTQVDLWLQYMSHPSQERLWAAHNADIAAGFKAAAPLLAREGSAEAQFAIYVTLRVLRMAPSVQADPWWDPTGPLSTKGPFLKWVTEGSITPYFEYPKTYPTQGGLPSTSDPWWYLGN